MPLLDHFHPPVSERRSWEGFHGLWAAALVEKLNRDILADEFFADMQVLESAPPRQFSAVARGPSKKRSTSSGAEMTAPAPAPRTSSIEPKPQPAPIRAMPVLIAV